LKELKSLFQLKINHLELPNKIIKKDTK